MKPLKLTMTALGPYKNQEIIDFAELDEHRLFVISGNTGAGKTTIFDAICFALYGEASGEERNDTRLMRSHFADEDVHTSVELDFMLHNRMYRVFRQIPHVKGSNKTATGGRYELYEMIGEEFVPCVDRFHVTDINVKIEQMIGLTKDQFSQIVMLPQGEFRKLLTSETENKEEILRRIFKTGQYKRFTERLKEKKQAAQKRYEQQAQERDLYMNQITGVLPEREEVSLFQVLAQDHYNVYQVVEALGKEVAYYDEEIDTNRKKQAELSQAYQKKTASYHCAQTINEKFQTLDDKRRKKAEMDNEITNIEKKQHRWEQAEKASHLDVYERHVKDAKLEENEKKLALQNAFAFDKEAAEILESAQSTYKNEEEKGDRRDQISREIDRLNNFLPIVRDLDTKRAELDQLSATLTKDTKKYEELEKKLLEDKKQKSRFTEEINQLEEGIEDYPENLEKLGELREQCNILREAIQMQKSFLPLKQTVDEKHQAYQTAQAAYDTLENHWFDGQAGVLAQHLHDGKPCPVCGSLDHPNQAVAMEDLPTKEELNRAKKNKEQKQTAWMQEKSELETTRKQFDDKVNKVREIGFQDDDFQRHYEHVVNQGTQLRKKTDTLAENQKKVKYLKEQLRTVEKSIEEKSDQIKTLGETLQAKRGEHQTQKALIQQKLEEIPKDLRSLKQLQKHLKETEQLKQQLENQWKQAQQQFQKAKEEAAAAKTNAGNAEAQVNEVTEKTEKASQQFETALAKAGFSDKSTYNQAKIPEDDRNALKREIETYKTERSNLTASIQELEQELDGQARFDIDALFQEMKQLEDLRDTAQNALQSSQNYKNEADKLKQNITEAAEKVKDVELAMQTVTDLYDVVRGDNPKKISFERYLQIEFLEQIVHAANERLTGLSNGQFYLMRSNRVEKRGRQSGLGLDVYDAYTGQTRDVKSLSGGEKFNASLCLALGMADVIQAFEGGISIETMFIDEGFGSLDEESLNKAIDTLIDLQRSGRIVGVISHVQELKNAIPAVLEVQKTKEGHSRTRFVLR